ncbi:hypothetical protein CONCODRAFT_9117 [Conidiobolus coronatus NRRL 28638]|uniref:G-protein coupled receptors family 1 profile domain-containing protein n=1 Tax=Conidiobolus coronatus (strain ATCC 28846 / CBS 209.66 / NRRL 28638) TaxID=796925 RepID=A0A137P0Q3_CONC2|nr:hypothetical protein CONCODRAFT_9117 [Conidiobolus coronatus NRRL 28638]|eukprot:KXN68597.1 hypothetical protein CONCODRAFT_9117 [Conidiobolus coronatus NRRL 28638]
MPLNTAAVTSSKNEPRISEALRTGVLIHFGICSILGLLLNLMLLTILVKKLKKNAHVDIKLCTFVTVMDISVCCCLLFRAIFAKYPYNILEAHSNWCKFDLLTGTQVLLYSGYSLGIMSLERFLLICYNIKFSFIYWIIVICLTCIPQFAMVCVVVAKNLQIMVKIKVYCSFFPKGMGVIVYIWATVMFFIAFSSVIISYLGIMIVKYKQCLNQLNLNVPRDKVLKECRSTLFKSLLYIVLYILIFSGKIYCLVFELITGQKRTIVMDLISTMLISCSSLVNALIVFYMNSEVRESFLKLTNQIIISIKNIRTR